jgi:hypothetical protein
MRSPRELLLIAAKALGAPLLDELVYVGGASTCLLITDPGAPPPRVTVDVDVIVEAATLSDYQDFGPKLRERGFREDDTEGAPICRWTGHGIILDVMPTEPRILGFSNRWYPSALARAERHELEPGCQIRHVSAPLFIATKLEALRGRGEQDYMASRDLEDIVAIVDGRDELLDEATVEEPELREYIASEFARLLGDRRFREAISAHMPADEAAQYRASIVLRRLEVLAGIPRAG